MREGTNWKLRNEAKMGRETAGAGAGTPGSRRISVNQRESGGYEGSNVGGVLCPETES